MASFSFTKWFKIQLVSWNPTSNIKKSSGVHKLMNICVGRILWKSQNLTFVSNLSKIYNKVIKTGGYF